MVRCSVDWCGHCGDCLACFGDRACAIAEDAHHVSEATLRAREKSATKKRLAAGLKKAC